MNELVSMEKLADDIEGAIAASGNSIMAMQRAMARLSDTMMRLRKGQDEIINSITAIETTNNKMAQRIEQVEKQQTHGTWSDEWVVQKGIGHRFKIAIGAVYVGKLLVAVGLARHLRDEKDGRYTVPYQQSITDGYARAYTTTSGHAHYQWHAGKTIEYIDQWMLKHGYWDRYVAVVTDTDMRAFISTLYTP